MAAVIDPETLDRLRTMTPQQAFEAAKQAVYGSGAVSSEDFLDVYEQMVDEGILTWEQVDAFEG
ncbi:MAG: hypothetical protein LAO51_04955 [Acidobacteriia bacterium]|nr:hypothetical protein [Terriglobia bacterium]